MNIFKMKTNRLYNPLGFELGDKPRLSWIVESDSAKKQAAAQVQVSLDENFEDIIFDSGKRSDINSVCYPLDIELKPRTRYYWRVKVWGDDGSFAVSEPAWFETSKMDEPWEAKWITPNIDGTVHPILFSDFNIEKEVKSARVYICGLGLFELSLNNQKVGDEYLSPGFTAYDKWIPYQTYDITDYVKEGENRIEVLLGNGWYKGRFGLDRQRNFRYGDKFALICEIVITYEDGTSQVFITDESTWRARKSNIIDSSIYDGEFIDGTMEDNGVYSVSTIDLDINKLRPRLNPPIKIKERLKPVEVIHTPAGETVLDMGQNMVGWIEFTNRAPAGEEIFLQFGEILQDGNFYRDNLRTAKCEFKYISNGKEEKVRPHFTFYGFRYVKLTKWYGEVNPDDFCGCVIYSDVEQTGSITTDNELVNKLFQNVLWGQKGNFLEIPTDCPQRDERMGWTGDAQAFSGTAAFNMDVYAFFKKYLYDLMQEQKERGGNVPVVVPAHDVTQNGACAWGDAATIIPWNMYVYYGDDSVLIQQYESMKGWVDFIKSRDEAAGDKRLWTNDFHFGDWLSLDVEDPTNNRFGGTDRTFLASAFYCFSARLVAKAARVLNKEEDAVYYEQLADEVREAIQKEYFTSSGRLAIDTQTAHVVALYMDLVPEEYKERIAYNLRLKLKESNYHLRTGFIGTPYLCRVLSEHGSNDIAYKLLTNTDYPSWLYQVIMGATTVWERWNSVLPDGRMSDTRMNSLNHYCYGSIMEWMYRNVAGIKPMEESPGFKRFKLEPQPNYLLKSLNVEFMSPAGKIISRWNIADDGSITFYFKIPFDATAQLILPDSEGTEAEGVHELESGEYTFTYMPNRPYKASYGIDTPIEDIHEDEKAWAVAEFYLSGTVNMRWFNMYISDCGQYSILDLIKQGLVNMDEETQKELDNKLRDIK